METHKKQLLDSEESLMYYAAMLKIMTNAFDKDILLLYVHNWNKSNVFSSNRSVEPLIEQ